MLTEARDQGRFCSIALRAGLRTGRPPRGAGRRAGQEGAGGLHRAEVPDVPRHRGQGQARRIRSTASARS
jgi:hypothetical protein